LGAYGDGGMITTDSEDLAYRVRMLRNYGQRVKYFHDEKGFNSRLDELQAAILGVKLRHLDDWIKLRRQKASAYSQFLDQEQNLYHPTEPVQIHHSQSFVLLLSRPWV